jgi:hypothetical protein
VPSGSSSANQRVRLTEHTKRYLRSESAGFCQNPGCRTELFSTADAVDIAEMAHVIPASHGGPRDLARDDMGLEERAAAGNILVLCSNCHTLIDKAPDRYDADLLGSWKREHIDRLAAALSTPVFASRVDARAHIEPLLEQNRMVFNLYGPDREDFSDDRAAQWRYHARRTIVPNNERIIRALDTNRHLLKTGERRVVELLRVHVREFSDRHTLGRWGAMTVRFPAGAAGLFAETA